MKEKVKLICAINGCIGIIALLVLSVLAPHADGKIGLALFIFILLNALIAN